KRLLLFVSFAGFGFGEASAPLVILSLYRKKVTKAGALAGMITGAVIVAVWGNISLLSDTLYEIFPAFVLNLIVTMVVSNMTYKQDLEIEEEFDEALRVLKEEQAKE